MKARLLRNNDELHLLLCTARIKKLTLKEAKEFIETYDEPSHYDGPVIEEFRNFMGEYNGTTLAVVDDNGLLVIHDPEFFRTILEMKNTYLTATQFAEKHEKKSAIVRKLCIDGRIEGARFVGSTWIIPEDAPYPPDARVGKRVPSRTTNKAK